MATVRNFTKLNGASSYFSADTALSFGALTQFEVELFCYVGAATAEQWLLGDWHEASANRSFGIRMLSGNLEILTSIDGATPATVITAALSVSELHRVVVKFNGGTVTLELDDAAGVTGSAGASTLHSSGLGALLGAKPGPSAHLNGYVSSVRVWSGGTRSTGNLAYRYNLDDTFAATTEALGFGATTTVVNLAVADTESFTLNVAATPDQWESAGAVVTLPLGYTPISEGYAVIVLAGQSNMIGRDSIVAGIDDDYSGVSDVVQWGYGANSKLQAINPLDHLDEQAGDMGLWLSMVKALVRSGKYSKPIMVVPCANGGTGFSNNNWNPGDARYLGAVARTTSALASDSLNTLEVFCWHQGETDAVNGNSTYLANIKAMRDAFIVDIGQMISSTPFIVGEIAGGGSIAQRDAINQALADFATDVLSAKLVRAKELPLFDTFHFNSASTRTLGSRYAALIQGSVYNIEWRDLATQSTTSVSGIDALFYDVSGLQVGTNYEFRAQEYDGATTSAWSAWSGFSTASITYTLEWREASGPGATTSVAAITDLFYDLAGLTPATNYEFRVLETDGVDSSVFSAWSPLATAASTANVDGTTSESASGADTWAATCAAAVSTSSAAVASDSLSVIASISASIISAAQASDQSGDSAVASVSLESSVTGSDSVDALASAAAALSSGAVAGELWTVQAQVVASLIESAAASDSIARATENALNAAISEGSAASDQFISAINALVGTEDTASANDAFIALVVTLAGFSSGAIASDSFGINFGQIKNIESGAISTDAWLILASLTASLSEVCSASDIMSARADVTASITSGAIATDVFSIVNESIRYLVMGAITLRSALNYSVSTKPALNLTVTIKPGN
jgi:hypothetical protein